MNYLSLWGSCLSVKSQFKCWFLWSLISQHDHPESKNRTDKCPTMELRKGHERWKIASKGERGSEGTGRGLEAFFILGVVGSNWKNDTGGGTRAIWSHWLSQKSTAFAVQNIEKREIRVETRPVSWRPAVSKQERIIAQPSGVAVEAVKSKQAGYISEVLGPQDARGEVWKGSMKTLCSGAWAWGASWWSWHRDGEPSK